MQIRVGLIGYGHAGAVFHAPLIASCTDYRLTAIVTTDPERRARAAREHPGAALVSDVTWLWDHARELDLVVVASPNRTHVAFAFDALGAGLPVVVDKPLAASAADARRLIEEAHRRQRLLTVFQNRRWDGDFLTVRRLLEQGDLGRILRFESRFQRWRPVRRPGWRELPAAEEAGGVLYDLGTHLLDQSLQLFGPVSHVYAEIDRRRPAVEPSLPAATVDDDVFVALTHAAGVRTHLWVTHLAPQFGPRMRVLGSAAAYTKYGLDPQEDALREGRRPNEAHWGEEPEDRWGTLGAEDDSRRVRTEPGAYQQFYASLAKSLRDGMPPPVDPEDAVATLEIIEAAQRSATASSVVIPRGRS